MINYDAIDPSVGIDVQVVDRVEDIKTTHKEEGSLAFGISWKLGQKAWLHLTHETFFGGKRYYIFDSDEIPSYYPYIGYDTLQAFIIGTENYISLAEETEARTNIGIGLELQLAKRLGSYLGARTNFSYKQFDDRMYETMYISPSTWNLVDFSGGFVYLTKKNKRYTVGMEYSTAQIHLLNSDYKVRTHGFKVILEIEVGKPVAQKSQ